MSRSSGVRASLASSSWNATAWSGATTPRLLAVAFGLLLTGAYLSVFYHVTDVAGGVQWFVASVGTAFAMATVAARMTSARGAVAVGGLLLGLGVLVYLAQVPELHDDLLSVDFVVRWLEYLTGISVLEFRRAGLWAIAVAPGVAFLSWSLLLRRRYEAAAAVGGLMLGFFAMTGDANPTTTVVGMTGLLGLLGAGTVERDVGSLGDVKRLGFVLAAAVLAARWLRLVPEAGALEPRGSGGGSGTSSLDPPLEGDLSVADERAHIHESISLSPTVLFTIEATEPSYWRAGAYDRYTGSDWIRTGGTAVYEDTLEPPPGTSRRVVQTVEVEHRVRTLPSAWKPLAIQDIHPNRVLVTDLEGLVPTGTLLQPDQYRVISQIPEGDPEQLRTAGAEYPPDVLERYLQLPESTSARVRELAEEIGGDASNPFDAAVAVRRWLADEKAYDLEVDYPGGDVADAFLFSMERGYCVYFASAMVVLLRSIDVPSRFVLGYTTGQRVGADWWVVRGLDSHAWVEVYFPDAGWVQFDPTPESDRRVLRRTFLEQARATDVRGVDTNESLAALAQEEGVPFEPFRDDLSAAQNRTAGANASSGASVAGPVTQESPASADGSTGQSPADSVTAALGSVDEWVGERDRLALLAGAVGLSIGLHWVGALERGVRAAKLRWQRPTDSPRRDAERAYHRLELLLARRFRPRRSEETRRHYLTLAGDVVAVDRARRVLDVSERASYGGSVTRAEADEAIRIVDQLVAEDR